MSAVNARCGPLEVHASAGSAELQDKLRRELNLLDVCWPEVERRVSLQLDHGPGPSEPCRGSYLKASRMHVDLDGDDYLASCDSGAWCRSGPANHRWQLTVPEAVDEWVHTDIERMLSLVLTSEWRALGWVPLHAGGVERGRCRVLLCAESGGGKSSLTAAFLHHGWHTLGDDKLLLRLEDGEPKVRALARTFNLHPNSARWFAEVGEIEHLPRYSSWTQKRKVHVEDYWPGQVADSARPTHLVSVRRMDRPGIRLRSMTPTEVLTTLMRQTVIPNDARSGRMIMQIIAATASRIRGLRFSVGPDAYASDGVLDDLLHELEAAS